MIKNLLLINKLCEAAGKPVLTNKNVCPNGYTYNDDGYIITDVYFPQLQVLSGPLFASYARKAGVENFIKYNLIVYKYLNIQKLKIQMLSFAKWIITFTGIFLPEEQVVILVDKLYDAEVDIKILPTKFLTYYNVWLAEDCTFNNRKEANKALTTQHIEQTRDKSMDVKTKWRPKDVAVMASRSESRVKLYFAETGYPKRADRTEAAVLEAISSIVGKGLELSVPIISLLSGVAERRVSTILKTLN